MEYPWVTRRWTARALAAGVRAGKVSAARLTADALAGVVALDPVLHFVDALSPGAAAVAAAGWPA